MKKSKIIEEQKIQIDKLVTEVIRLRKEIEKKDDNIQKLVNAICDKK